MKYSPTRPNRHQIWCLFGLVGEYSSKDREISGSTLGKYNLQIKITSKSWSGEPETPSLVEAFHAAFYSSPHWRLQVVRHHRMVVQVWLHVHHSPSVLDGRSGLVILSTASCTSALGGVPRLLTTPGQTWCHTMPHQHPEEVQDAVDRMTRRERPSRTGGLW